jgi:carboxyl-terminal processing protease
MKLMRKNIIKTSIYVVASLILLSGVFSVGAYVGYNNRPAIEKVLSVIHKEPQLGITTTADFNSFWKVWNLINEKSIYADKASDQDRVWGAISGLVASLDDPYSVFFPPKENKAFNDEIRGSFSGIGAEIGMKDKVLTIIAPLKDTPAWKSGIKKGDKILKINNIDTSDMTVDKAISLIRGPTGTVVALTIIRPNENKTREFKITRDNIDIPTVDTELLKDNIFVIKFYSFSQNSDSLFRDALIKFANSGSHKLIIDLRGNPGGYLDSAVNIGSWFIDEGKIIVSEDFGGNRKPQIYRSHGPRLFNDNLKLVVLVDGGSASASEILAGALQEHGIATLVGEQTFGKGSVQELVNVTDDTSLKVTVAKWLTPNGTSISLKGLTPDVKVSITDQDIANHNDSQQNKAVEILSANP